MKIHRLMFIALLSCVVLGNVLFHLSGLQKSSHVCRDVISTRNITSNIVFVTSYSPHARHNTRHDLESNRRGIISQKCRTILYGDTEEIQKLRNENTSNDVTYWRDEVTTDRDVLKWTVNCSDFRKRYKFPPSEGGYYNVTKGELEFPIAYSILVHENIHQMVQLLSAIYREHNIHCIHIDSKSEESAFEALRSVTRCFPNVFIASERHRVVYASVSRLLADIACMKDLLHVPKNMYNWKYLINLCSQDFPLRTNKEIVEQLKVFRGVNSIGGYANPSQMIKERTKFVYRIENFTYNGKTEERVSRTRELHTAPPYNMTMRKNLAYNLFSRNFLQWALEDSIVGKDLLNWSMDTYSPDEHFWLMLHTYPGAPGGSSLMSGYQLAREIKWSDTNKENTCFGEWKHHICILGAENIRNLTQVRNLFANKLDIRVDSTGVECLRQWLDERNFVSERLRPDSNPKIIPDIPSSSFYE